MNGSFLLLLFVIAAASIAVMAFLHRRQYSGIGETTCRWYTIPALMGIGIMTVYTLAAAYMYLTTEMPTNAGLIAVGLVLVGFYVIYGQAAIGSRGVFWSGRLIPWETISGGQLTEQPGNRLRWRLQWRSSPGAAGQKSVTIVIPSSRRTQAEAKIRSTIKNGPDDSKKEIL